jgi:hypothetical protein
MAEEINFGHSMAPDRIIRTSYFRSYLDHALNYPITSEKIIVRYGAREFLLYSTRNVRQIVHIAMCYMRPIFQLVGPMLHRSGLSPTFRSKCLHLRLSRANPMAFLEERFYSKMFPLDISPHSIKSYKKVQMFLCSRWPLRSVIGRLYIPCITKPASNTLPYPR